MKALWGMMVVDGRGKLGGHVLSKNRSGAYARTKVTPVNPQTSYQQTARNRLTSFSQGWRALSQAQIAAWNAAVSAFATSNIFANIVNPTGKNLYTKLNINLETVAQAPITNPPLPSGAGTVTAGTVVAVNGGAKSVVHTGDTAGHSIQVWATEGVSPGKLFVKNKFRLVDFFAGGAASPHVFTTEYNAKFGQPPVGTRVAVRLVSINNTTGEASVASEASVIVT